jgi:hypothetical protein
MVWTPSRDWSTRGTPETWRSVTVRTLTTGTRASPDYHDAPRSPESLATGWIGQPLDVGADAFSRLCSVRFLHHFCDKEPVIHNRYIHEMGEA